MFNVFNMLDKESSKVYNNTRYKIKEENKNARRKRSRCERA